MLQRYKPIIGHVCQDLIQWPQYEVRVGGKRYNVTRHFEMCVLRLNLPFKDDTALQAKNCTYMSETKTMAVTDL